MTNDIVAYSIHIRHFYGAPGQTSRRVIWIADYTCEDGSVSGDLDYFLNDAKVNGFKFGRVISITPLYAGSPIYHEESNHHETL